MHKIGENVVYGSNGVMAVEDVRIEHIGDTERKYYVLRPLNMHSDSLIFVPVDNDNLVAMMRPLLTVAEAQELISSIVQLPEAAWIKDNRIRAEKFKSTMDLGVPKDVIGLMKAIRSSEKRRNADGKKNFLSDENIMHRAEKLMFCELSIVLNITEEKAAELVRAELAKCEYSCV